ncbi:PIN domain-containing protein [Blastopirellula marina]|nr:PIN domain-containing protein [Blastopirellula marina]
MNYLLIDYENVHPQTLERFSAKPTKVLVFYGATQKAPEKLERQIKGLGHDAECIQISGCGRNALDFHITFTIGQLSKVDPDAHFHVLTMDKGFDPLIQYARRNGIYVQRHKNAENVNSPKTSTEMTLEEKVIAILKRLRSLGKSRPKRLKTLSNAIKCWFQNKLGESELKQLIAALKQQGRISVDGKKVECHLKSRA